MKSYFIFICIILSLSFNLGCSSKYIIKDILDIPQSNIKHLPENKLHYNHVTSDFHKVLNEHYNQYFYAPWDRDEASYELDDVMWGFEKYRKKLGYGENDKKHTVKWIDDLLKNAAFDNYPNTNLKAITINNSNLRVLPTSKPHFYNKKKLGEGFPFDNLQNSAIFANTPIFISHISKDKAWVLAESPYCLGWLPINDIAYVNDEFIKNWNKEKAVAVIKEKLPIYDNKNNFLFNASIGSQFPLNETIDKTKVIEFLNINDYVSTNEIYDKYSNKIYLLDVHSFGIPPETAQKIKDKEKEKRENYSILIAVKKSSNVASIEKINISKLVTVPKPLELTKSNIALLSDLMIDQPYGWGGMFENRDCSAMIKDLFTPFSIWLPRNSTYQAKYGGTYILLDGLPRKKKKELIIKNAIPYVTLIRSKGHIMLYLGTHKGEPLVFHNVWGLRYRPFLKKKKLHVIGKAVITTLEPGNSLPGSKPLIDRVTGITFLVPTKKY